MAKIVKKKVKKRKANQTAKQTGSNLDRFGDKLKQFKPGQSGNPKGAPRARTNFHRYLCQFMEMTAAELKKLNTKDMTLSQRAALKHALATEMGIGDFPRAKDLMDRDERTEDREQGIPDHTVEVTIKYV